MGKNWTPGLSRLLGLLCRTVHSLKGFNIGFSSRVCQFVRLLGELVPRALSADRTKGMQRTEHMVHLVARDLQEKRSSPVARMRATLWSSSLFGRAWSASEEVHLPVLHPFTPRDRGAMTQDFDVGFCMIYSLGSGLSLLGGSLGPLW